MSLESRAGLFEKIIVAGSVLACIAIWIFVWAYLIYELSN